MSLTVVIWLLMFIGLSAMAFKRPVYGVAMYMLTFFLSPPFWWWGAPIATIRWNLYGGIILLIAVTVSNPRPFASLAPKTQTVLKLGMAMFVNATIVHFLLADSLEISSGSYTLLWKFMLLVYLIFASVKTKSDFKIVMLAILIGAAYIGYEVTFNERGEIHNNRLEGIGAPGAGTANHFASLMVTILPLVAPFFLVGSTKERLLVIILAPLILNVVLLCNSRGAFLAAIASGIVFLAAAPREVRGKAIKLVLAGSVATFMLMGDTRILDRFMTTFAGEEERDNSAQSRFEFAKAGIALIKDHPLGAGGDGFKKVHGLKYLQKLGVSNEMKALHNGYLNEACEWGIQGLALRISFYFVIMFAVWKSLRQRDTTRRVSQDEMFFMLAGCSFLSGCTALLVTSLFGDHIDSEWGLWLVALMLAYMTLTRMSAPSPVGLDQQPASPHPNQA